MRGKSFSKILSKIWDFFVSCVSNIQKENFLKGDNKKMKKR